MTTQHTPTRRPDYGLFVILIVALAALALFGTFAWLRLVNPVGRDQVGRILAQRWGVILFVLALQAIATFVFFKRPTDRAARALFLGACGRLASAVWVFEPPVSELPGGIGFWGYQIATFGGWMLMWAAGLHFALLFPRPNPIIERHRWVVPLLYVAPYPIHAAYLLATWLATAGTLDWLNQRGGDAIVLEPAYLGLLLVALVLGYRAASDAVSRQQVRWVVFAIAVSGCIYSALGIVLPVALGHLVFDWNVLALFGLIVPLAFAIAILRYRLWDIDIIINRTLVYFLLTAIVVGVYMLVVGSLSALLQARGSLPISLLGVGLVAVVFHPLRDRLQRAVNRLMYGERDDPYAVLSRLGQRLEGTLAPEAVLPTLVETIKESLKLPYAAIALKQGEAFAVAAASGILVNDALHLPLVYQNETVGQLLLAPRTPGEAFSPADRHLLDDLARQAGVAVHAVRLTTDLQRLTTDLQRSRERLVTAREEERRRLRRDLHDGLGPALANLTLQIEAARDLLPHNTARADALLVDLTAQAQAAIADIRRLVYDLRPPALDELGLVSALREQAAQYAHTGVQITVDAPESLPPLPAAVEVAAYRIAQEALTNVVRHAHARNCAMQLALNEALCLEIRDDGCGLPVAHHVGVGLSSMRERAAELGGQCVIEAAPDRGTRVRARLPLG